MARRKSTPNFSAFPSLAAGQSRPGAPPPPLFSQALQAVADRLTGTAGKTKTDLECDALREMCRRGNPFPLIGYQWPELLVTDPREQEIFREIPAGGLDLVTPGMRVAVLREKNPILRLDWWQRIILAGIFDVTVAEVFIKGCTGAGKGASVGIANCLWYDVHDECRVTLTSRDYEHAATGIFGEVKQWFLKMRHPSPANVLGESIGLHERRYINIKNPSQSSGTAGEAFSGHHGKATMYTADEATAVADTIFENMEKNARKIIALANPRTLSGRFREAYKPLGVNENRIAVTHGVLGNRLCVTVAGMDCMNVRHSRLKNPVAPAGGIEISNHKYSAGDRISDEHYEFVKPLITSQIDLVQYRGILAKSDPRLVDVFAHGRFPKEDPDKQVILSSWLDFHIKAHAELQQTTPAGVAQSPKVEAFALDVARSVDGDHSCLAAGGQDGCHSLKLWQYQDINQLCNAVVSHIRETFSIELGRCQHPIVVDCDGLGAGAADILRSRKCWVIEYRGNSTSEVDRGIFGNMRAEGYGTLGRRLNPDDRWRGRPWAIPDDKLLHEELCAPEKEYSADALRFHLTPKNTPPGRESVVSVKKKLGRSPDRGDSVVMLFYAVRILHDLNDWFRSAARDLITYPAPPDRVPPPPGSEEEKLKMDPSKPRPDDSPATAGLREQYGKLLDKEDKQDPPDWLPIYRNQVVEEQERARLAKLAAEGKKEEPAPPPAWHERIWQDQD